MTDDIRHTLSHKSGQTKVQRWPNKVDLRAEWPLQGIQSEKVASGCSPISTNHVALFGLSCTRLGLVSTLHLALAIFQQGAPCFGHRPINSLSEKSPAKKMHTCSQTLPQHAPSTDKTTCYHAIMLLCYHTAAFAQIVRHRVSSYRAAPGKGEHLLPLPLQALQIQLLVLLVLLFRSLRPPRSICLLYTSPSPRDQRGPRMPSSA